MQSLSEESGLPARCEPWRPESENCHYGNQHYHLHYIPVITMQSLLKKLIQGQLRCQQQQGRDCLRNHSHGIRPLRDFGKEMQ